MARPIPRTAAVLIRSAAFASLALPALAASVEDLPMRELDGLQGPSAGRAISNTPIANVPLIDEGIVSLSGYNLRTRSWVIEAAGGVVPIHSHIDRPAMVYSLAGEIYEYRSDADERLLHGPRSLSIEEGAITHWWLNEGAEDVRLIAWDVYNAGGDDMVMRTAPPAQAIEMPDAADATLELLGVVDIGAHFGGDKGNGFALSAYRAEIAPGGVLPGFTDGGEPLQIWVWQGEVTEHRSDQDTPIVISAEAGSQFVGGVQGWWENTGAETAEVFFGVVEPLSEVEGVERTGQSAHEED